MLGNENFEVAALCMDCKEQPVVIFCENCNTKWSTDGNVRADGVHSNHLTSWKVVYVVTTVFKE
jgi:hypothetical protein